MLWAPLVSYVAALYSFPRYQTHRCRYWSEKSANIILWDDSLEWLFRVFCFVSGFLDVYIFLSLY